jgi:hypothetical protein
MTTIDRELCQRLLVEISDRLNDGDQGPVLFGIVIYSDDSRLPFMTGSNDGNTAQVSAMFSLSAAVVQREKPIFKQETIGKPIGNA